MSSELAESHFYLQIHGMETAQQLSFQQGCDKTKPLHWPNIPLKIEFT